MSRSPLRARGLKPSIQNYFMQYSLLKNVALFTGAWIETLPRSIVKSCSSLSRFLRARGLKRRNPKSKVVLKVALFTGAWIETHYIHYVNKTKIKKSRSLRARGLKHLHLYTYSSHLVAPLRARGLKLSVKKNWYKIWRRALYGRVD